MRIVVFIFQSPFNNDDHFGVIQYIYSHHAIPVSNQLSQSYHPALYYVLASLFFPYGEKIIQLISLLLSIAALYIIYRLIQRLEFVQPVKIKKYCLLLTCLLPQFIMFGNYISNDSLSIFIGALIFFQIFRYINKPGMLNQNILAIYLGLGLLTKGTFLAFIPPLILLIILVNFRRKINLKQSVLSMLVFIFIFSALGSYKYIENAIHFHRPIVHNLEAYFLEQKVMYSGLKSAYDINILKLCRYPVLSEHTRHSYPLMLYGTFWYQHIPESNFTGNQTIYKYLGSCIYIFALLPTLLFFIGFLKILFSIKSLFNNKNLDSPAFNKAVYGLISLFLLLSSLLLVIIAGVKYNTWGCFQSRLLFASFFSIIILFNSGLDYIEKRCAIAKRAVYLWLRCLYSLFIVYFGIEIIRLL